MAYAVLPVFDPVDPDSAMGLAERSAARALALDSTLAEAHLALGYALKNRWRFEEAGRDDLAGSFVPLSPWPPAIPSCITGTVFFSTPSVAPTNRSTS